MHNDAAISVAGGDKHKGIMQQEHDTDGSTSVDSAKVCTGERCIDREEGFASQFYSTCLRGFRQLCRQEQEGYAPGARSYLLKEELGKLYLWGESFSPGELDKALDEYEEIRDNVLDLLVNLGELIIRALRTSSTVAQAGQIHEIESSIERARLIASDVDGQEDVDVLPGDTKCLDRDDYSDDDMADFCEDVAFTIKCLTELGPSLQQNLASAGRPAPPVSESKCSLPCPSGPAGFYVSLVREKFKLASKGLIERLGEANWQRHVRVRNIMQDLENNPAKGQDTSGSVFRPETTFHDSGIGTSVPAWTQYAPSHTSFRTSNPEGGPRALRVPPAPLEAADGKPFQCYLCGDMLSTVRTRTQWKMHVFSDLMPYLCTFDGCQHKVKSFQSRSSWADHEFQEHRLNIYWACPECSRKSCSTLEWEHHLDDVHNLKFSVPDLVAARKNACYFSPKRAEEEKCPLCQEIPGNSRRAFVKHVSQHMEDIALMALPTNAEEDSETGSVHTDHASVRENDVSKDDFGDDNGSTVNSEWELDWWQDYDHQANSVRYDPGDGLVPGSPEVERPFVLHSGIPAETPPAERSPTPEFTDMSKPKERRQHPKARMSQGDAISIGSMGDLNAPDLASKAGQEPLSEESDEPAGEGEVESRSSRLATEMLRTATPISKSSTLLSQYRDGPHGKMSPDLTHWGFQERVDPFVQRPDLSMDDKWRALGVGRQALGVGRQALGVGRQVLGNRRSRRRFTPEERAEVAMKRKSGACTDCHKLKRKCKHVLPGDHTVTPSSLTSSTVPTNSPLPHTPQTTKSTREPIGNPTKPTEIDPSQVSLSETIDDRRNRLPPVPLFPSANTQPPSDHGLDQGNSPPHFWDDVGGWHAWDDVTEDMPTSTQDVRPDEIPK